MFQQTDFLQQSDEKWDSYLLKTYEQADFLEWSKLIDVRVVCRHDNWNLGFLNDFYYGADAASVFVACDAVDFVEEENVAFALGLDEKSSRAT